MASSLLTNLVSYWKCDENSGDLIDIFGSNNLGDNATVTSTSGKIRNSRQYTAANTEYHSIVSNSTLQRGGKSWSVSLWAYIDSLGTRGLVCKENNITTAEFRIDLASSRFRLITFNGAGNLIVLTANTFGAPSTATWYHVVAWFDYNSGTPNNSTLNMRINAGTAETPVTATSAGVPTNTAAAFQVGRQPTSPGYWDGRLDEIGLWDRVLTSSEIVSLYNGGGGLGYPFENRIFLSNDTNKGILQETGFNIYLE